jgi:hypothetical protein
MGSLGSHLKPTSASGETACPSQLRQAAANLLLPGSAHIYIGEDQVKNIGIKVSGLLLQAQEKGCNRQIGFAGEVIRSSVGPVEVRESAGQPIAKAGRSAPAMRVLFILRDD